MVDTIRLLAALQALFADNSSGAISPQDLRDFLVSAMPTGRFATRVVAPYSASPGLVQAQADYMATATSAEDTINDAITAVHDAGGGLVLLLPGTYNTDGPINMTDPAVELRGSGRRNTTIDVNHTGDGIHLHPASTLEHFKLGGFKVDCYINSSTGSAIRVESARHVLIEEVWTTGAMYALSLIGIVGKFWARQCHFVNWNTAGIYMECSPNAQAIAQVGFENTMAEAGSATCPAGTKACMRLNIGAGDADEIDELVLLNCNFNGESEANITGIDCIVGTFSAVAIGTMFNNLLHVLDMTNFTPHGDTDHVYWEFQSCRFGLIQGSHFVVQGNRTEIDVHHSNFNCLTTGTNLHFFEFMNDASSPKVHLGPHISGTNANGNAFYVGAAATPSIFIDEGVDILEDVADRLDTIGGSGVPTIRGVNKSTEAVWPQLVTCNSGGPLTIANTETTEVVTHGLSFTPLAEHITIIPLNQPTNDIGLPWISAIGATTFTVNIKDPGAAGFNFQWSVRML